LIEDRIATKNLVPGKKVYGEKLARIKREEYRIWNPRRSKLAAAIHNGLKDLPIGKDAKVLYLGAASGTTASHISDIAPEGIIYCVEFSPRVFRELTEVCGPRENMIPILGDARRPEEYGLFLEEVDLIYQDVAQPRQAEILKRNSIYLRRGGHAMIAIKARSIDAVRPPEEIFSREIARLKKDFEVLQVVNLEPYEKDHSFILLKF
jgi:fibrillarin-like pre-rRNA processing protein